MIAIKPRDILVHAELLLEQNPKCDEVMTRLLVNRAYYASYNQTLHEIENRLFFKLSADKKTGSHQKLINACKEHKYPTQESAKQKKLAEVTTLLHSLRSLRETADYKLQTRLSASHAEQSLAIANKIYDGLESLT